MFVSETFLRAGRPSYSSNDLVKALITKYSWWHYVFYFSRQWSHDVQHNRITCPLIVLLFGCNDETNKCSKYHVNETSFAVEENKARDNSESSISTCTKHSNDAGNWRLIFCKCIQDVRNVQRNFTEVEAIRVLLESTPIGLRPNRFSLLTVLEGETHEKINLFNVVEWTNMCNCIGRVVEHVDLLDKTKVMFSCSIIHIDNKISNSSLENSNEIACDCLTKQSIFEVKSSQLHVIQSAVEWFRRNGNVYHQMLSDCSLPSQEKCLPLFHLLEELNPLLWCGNFVNAKRDNDDNNHDVGATKTEKGNANTLQIHESGERENNQHVCCEEYKQKCLECKEEQHQSKREEAIEEQEEESEIHQKLNAMKLATRSLWQQKIGNSTLFAIPIGDRSYTAVNSSVNAASTSCNGIDDIRGEQTNQTSEWSDDKLSTKVANDKLSQNARMRYVYAVYWQRPLSVKKEVDLDNYNAGPLSPQPVSAELHLFTDRGDAFYVYQQMINPSLNEFTFDDYLHEEGEVFVQLAPVEAIQFDDIDRLLNILGEGKRAELFANLHTESESCCSIIFPRVFFRAPTGHNVKANPLAKYHSEVKQMSPSEEMVEDVICALKYISEHTYSLRKCNTIGSNEQSSVQYSLQDLCTIKTFNTVKSCAWCGRAREKMLKCAACGAVWYCSRSHQILDWKEGNHKLECKDWKQAKQLYEENLKTLTTSHEEWDNSLSSESINEILKSYCNMWNSFNRSEGNSNTAVTTDSNVCGKGDEKTTSFIGESANNHTIGECNKTSILAEVTKVHETIESFDRRRRNSSNDVLETGSSVTENLHESNISSNEDVHNSVETKVIRADCCVGWSYAISTLEFVKQLLCREAQFVKCNSDNATSNVISNIAELKQVFCVHIVGVDVSVYESFLWLLVACINSIKHVLLQTNTQIRVVLCSDTFTEFQRNEVWQVVKQVCDNGEPLSVVKKVSSTGVLGDTWREKQKDTHEAAEVSSAFVLVRLINTKYYLLYENKDLNDKSNWPNTVISFGPSDGTGCSYFNASMETIVNHFLGHVPVRFVESSYIGACRTRRAILARTSTSDKCDAFVKKVMQNESKQKTKAPMAINVNRFISTDFAFTGHAAAIMQALNKYCTNSEPQEEETKLNSSVDGKTNDGNNRSTLNTKLCTGRSSSNDSNNTGSSNDKKECSYSPKSDINNMYVKKNGYYFDIMPFC